MNAANCLRRSLLGLCLLLPALAANADEACRIAFDMGSSGIRAGANGSAKTGHADIDFLAPLWAGRGLDELAEPTIAALRDLPAQAGLPDDCPRVGGGFSAWRLAAQQDAGKLADLLIRIRIESDVAVLVIPQAKEGGYGYLGARQLLGERLATSHVLDIGGGSLQIAGERTSFGEALGQKIWHRHLCEEIRNSESTPCQLQPMTGEELSAARSLLAGKLQSVSGQLGGPVSMTAISRPVSRGVLPALEHLTGVQSAHVSLPVLSSAIDRLARLTMEEMTVLLGSPSSHAAFLLSDMLLVEGLMQASGSDDLQVAEIDLTNLPGILADDKAYAWQSHYACYIDRLRQQGVSAYASDPATCP